MSSGPHSTLAPWPKAPGPHGPLALWPLAPRPLALCLSGPLPLAPCPLPPTQWLHGPMVLKLNSLLLILRHLRTKTCVTEGWRRRPPPSPELPWTELTRPPARPWIHTSKHSTPTDINGTSMHNSPTMGPRCERSTRYAEDSNEIKASPAAAKPLPPPPSPDNSNREPPRIAKQTGLVNTEKSCLM